MKIKDLLPIIDGSQKVQLIKGGQVLIKADVCTDIDFKEYMGEKVSTIARGTHSLEIRLDDTPKIKITRGLIHKHVLIHCENAMQAWRLFEIADNLGYKWRLGYSYKSNDFLQPAGKYTYYDIKDGVWGDIRKVYIYNKKPIIIEMEDCE